MQIKYFSWVKEQIGVDTENITLNDGIETVIDLINHLKNKSEIIIKLLKILQ